MLVFINLCRLCTGYKNVSSTLNSLDSDNIRLLHKINSTIPGLLESGSDLPHGICTNCIAQLNETYEFISNCNKSQLILKEYLQQLRNGKVLEEIIGLKIGENENVEQVCCKTEIISENVENKSSLNRETVESFEYVQCNIGQEIKQEKVDEPEQMNYYNEIDLSNSGRETNFAEVDNFNLQNGTITKEEEILPFANCKLIVNNYGEEDTNFQSEHGVQIMHDIFSQVTSFERSFVCKICDESFNNSAHLKSHTRTHRDSESFNCTICQKVCIRKYDLIKHMRVHTNEKPHKCEICGKSFIDSSNLKRHIRIHTNEKPFKCDICEKLFADKSNLLRHTRMHSGEREKPFECQLCQRSFYQSGDLKRHIERHMNEARHKCEQCEAAFKFKDGLKQHIRTAHGC